MSIVQLVLVILGLVAVIFGVIDLTNAEYILGGVLVVVGLVLLGFSRGGMNLTL